MTEKSALESGLFRLCIALKVVFWAALLAILFRSLWAIVVGRELADPTVLLLIVAVLAGLQVAAVFAWWRVRSARLKRNAP